MALHLTTDKKKLTDLVSESGAGTLALPQFQRNFVWSRDKIEDLIRSLVKGYYIGTFLVLDVDKDSQPFAIRPMMGVDIKPQDLRPNWLMLDGQQRLTSIFYAFTAPNEGTGNTKHPYRFFIRLDKLIDGNDDEVVFSERADWGKRWEDREAQYNERVLPLSEVPQWSRWKDGYDDWLADTGQHDLRERYRTCWRDPWSDAVEDNLLNVLIPYVQLPKVRDDDREGIAEVCAIFEKINSTGEPLGVFDLLTARLYKFLVDGQPLDLHALWELAMEKNPKLQEFTRGSSDRYGIYVLRTLALIRGTEVKAKSLVNLEPEGFIEDWELATSALENALQRLKSTNPDGFGVFDYKWQPYTTLLPVLAASLHALQYIGDAANAYADLKAWYWGSVFTERYSGSIESISYRDATDLLKRFRDETSPVAAFKDIREQILENPGFSFRDVSRNNSRYRGIINLIAIQGARDFATNDSIEFHELEDHHVFPRAFLRDDKGVTESAEVNSITNRTLISGSTNRRISRKSPNEYLQSVMPESSVDSILVSHFINAEAMGAMQENDYDRFRVARDRTLVTKVRELVARAR